MQDTLYVGMDADKRRSHIAVMGQGSTVHRSVVSVRRRGRAAVLRCRLGRLRLRCAREAFLPLAGSQLVHAVLWVSAYAHQDISQISEGGRATRPHTPLITPRPTLLTRQMWSQRRLTNEYSAPTSREISLLPDHLRLTLAHRLFVHLSQDGPNNERQCAHDGCHMVYV